MEYFEKEANCRESQGTSVFRDHFVKIHNYNVFNVLPSFMIVINITVSCCIRYISSHFHEMAMCSTSAAYRI